MTANIFVASARRVFIAGQIKVDLNDCNPISSIWFEINERDLNRIVLAIFSAVGKYGRTKNVVQRGFFADSILLDFLANDISNGRSKSSVVTIGTQSLLLLAAKSVIVVIAISKLSSMYLAATIDGVVLNSVCDVR